MRIFRWSHIDFKCHLKEHALCPPQSLPGSLPVRIVSLLPPFYRLVKCQVKWLAPGHRAAKGQMQRSGLHRSHAHSPLPSLSSSLICHSLRAENAKVSFLNPYSIRRLNTMFYEWTHFSLLPHHCISYNSLSKINLWWFFSEMRYMYVCIYIFTHKSLLPGL